VQFIRLSLETFYNPIPMPNYFYTDASGLRQGPINDQQLHALAANGIIKHDTPLETDGGIRGLAGQISGLNFSNATSSSRPHSPQTLTMQAGALAKKTGAGGVLSWLLDFSFQDLRLPIINLWACRIAYVICWIVAVLALLGGTLRLLGVAVSAPSYAQPGVFISCFLLILGLWIIVPLYIMAVRLLCEWYIIIFDWIVETTKAARLIVDDNKTIRK